ncbi:MAG: sialidase family protein [Pirellulales bacterium]
MTASSRALIQFAGYAIGWVAAVSKPPAALAAAADVPERFTLPAPDGVNVCAYPSIARLDDDRLLCVYSAHDPQRDEKVYLVGVVSDDHGSTWSRPEVLIDTPDGNDYDPSIIVIGKRVIVSATTTPPTPGITTSRTMAVGSDDGARSWSPPYEIPMGRRYTSGKVNNGIVTADGTALLGFTWEKNLETGPRKRLDGEGEMEEVNAVLMSFDEGRTWAASESVELTTRRAADSAGAINGVCEPALIECDDGSIFMLSRTGLTNLYGCRSTDGGRSWSKAEPTSLVGHNAPASLCRFDGERPGVLAVWNNSPQNRWPLCVAASFDGCRTWTTPREVTDVEGVEVSYPGCTPTGDGKLLVVYQQTRKDGRDIRAMRFDPEWVVGNEAAANDDAGAVLKEARPPQKVAHFPVMPKPAVLPDGTWALYFINHEGPGMAPTPDAQNIYACYSTDEGRSWGEPQQLVDLPTEAGGFGYHVVMVDHDGEVHVFMLCDAGTGAVRPRPTISGKSPYEPLARQRLDIWHVKSLDRRTRWNTPRSIWQGRAADLQSVTQLENGRIVLPVSYLVNRSWSNRGEGPSAFTYHGQFDTTAIYSDDKGETWLVSPSTLRVATPDLSSYGGVEPAVLQLADGRVWMLLRTQLGRFYESFSHDGSEWSPLEPTNITSSDSPAALARLPDGRILLLWNNCQRHPYAQGSRHVLHAAVSADEGRTWSGSREIVRDPHRDSLPPPSGDHGVSYPFVAVTNDGSVLFSLWVETGEGRSLWRLDPAWLQVTSAGEDFSTDLAEWSTFGTRGVSVTSHPDTGQPKVLSLTKQNAEWPTTAVWNFPQGSQGSLRTRVFLAKDSPPLRLELTDHFSPPFDEQSPHHSLFQRTLAANDRANNSVDAPADRWITLELQWDCDKRICRLTLDGKQHDRISQQRASASPSYLRLSLAGSSASEASVLVDAIEVDVKTENGNQPVASRR